MPAATWGIVLSVIIAFGGALVASVLAYLIVAIIRVTVQTARGEHDKSAGRFILSSKKEHK